MKIKRNESTGGAFRSAGVISPLRSSHAAVFFGFSSQADAPNFGVLFPRNLMQRSAAESWCTTAERRRWCPQNINQNYVTGTQSGLQFKPVTRHWGGLSDEVRSHVGGGTLANGERRRRPVAPNNRGTNGRAHRVFGGNAVGPRHGNAPQQTSAHPLLLLMT